MHLKWEPGVHSFAFCQENAAGTLSSCSKLCVIAVASPCPWIKCRTGPASVSLLLLENSQRASWVPLHVPPPTSAGARRSFIRKWGYQMRTPYRSGGIGTAMQQISSMETLLPLKFKISQNVKQTYKMNEQGWWYLYCVLSMYVMSVSILQVSFNIFWECLPQPWKQNNSATIQFHNKPIQNRSNVDAGQS